MPRISPPGFPAARAALALAALAAPAGAQEARQGHPPPDLAPVPSEPLDQAALEALARELASELQALLGRPFERPVGVELVDAEELGARARAANARGGGAPGEATDQIVGELLGLFPGELDLAAWRRDVLAEPWFAYYDEGEETCLVDAEAPAALARVVLAHELARALGLQHQGGARSDADAPNADADLARRAVLEGSGLELLTRWVQSGGAGLDPAELWSARDALEKDALAAAPPMAWKPLLLTYVQGPTFLRRQGRPSLLAGPALVRDILAALDEPPRSSEQILHPTKYWDPERADEPRQVACDLDGLEPAWTVVREDTFGELACAVLTTPFEERAGMRTSLVGMLGTSFTHAAASGWGGDRYVLLERDGGYLLCMSLAWDDEREADEFRVALEGLAPQIAERVGTLAGAERGSGFVVERGEADEVRVAAWVGVGLASVESARAAVRFRSL